MKSIKIIIAAVLVMAGMSVSAQWTTNGSNIYFNGGSVGIGTTTPHSQYLLHVSKNITGPQITIHNTGGAGGAGFTMIDDLNSANWKFKSAFGGGFKIRDHANSLDVVSFEGNSMVNAIYVKQGGFVGIGGNSNPQTALDVNGVISCHDIMSNGKITTKEVEVTLTGWPDYVFGDDYQLKSLNEVEAFIKENKHLPGIPSENEVLSNGIELGNMNKLLLEKVEELTLYVIELQKEVNKLKTEK